MNICFLGACIFLIKYPLDTRLFKIRSLYLASYTSAVELDLSFRSQSWLLVSTQSNPIPRIETRVLKKLTVVKVDT